MEAIQKTLHGVIEDVFKVDLLPVLTRPDEQFGDYATNVALQLAGRVERKPREIAEELAAKFQAALGDQVQEVTVAGPGFINLRLSDAALAKQVERATTKPQPYQDQLVVTEYSDPNPFKVLHAGHFYTSVIGDVISNLIAVAGGEVHRVNFGGDVGMHAAKTMWAILEDLQGEHPEKLANTPEDQRSDWMAKCYVAGTQAYEDNEQAKTKITELNKRIYQLHTDQDHDSPFAKIYWTCRQWSYDYFEAFYQRIGITPFEKYYPESTTAPLGLQTVKEQLAKGVYQESDGAIVFKGEPHGLHTRVFVNSQGLPTYEAKDVGLIKAKWEDYHFDQSVVITGNDIVEYMKVVLKSIEQFAPELAQRTTHLTHGNVKLEGGVKMSSRRGNILRAIDVLDAAATANKAATGRDDEQAVLGAIKYAFLKQRIGPDVIYSPKESVSLQGNSGPYLQYAHARARSILAKAGETAVQVPADFQSDERSLARKIAEYPEVIAASLAELMPHHICTYLYELAQVFNRFYEHNRVVDDPREAARLALVRRYADVLQDGLGLLGIAAPDRM